VPPRAPSDRRTLPLAARDALVRLLLADLAGGRTASCVAGALEVASLAEGARVAGDEASARVGEALLAAGLVAHVPADGGPTTGTRALVRVAPRWEETAVRRLQEYDVALRGVARGGDLTARLAQARRLFALRLHFEVHEVLEPPWQRAGGDDRRTLQGLIQAAVAWHHWRHGNVAGATRLANAARVKLESAPDDWHGFPVAVVRRGVVTWERWLADGARGAAPPLPFARAEGEG